MTGCIPFINVFFSCWFHDLFRNNLKVLFLLLFLFKSFESVLKTKSQLEFDRDCDRAVVILLVKIAATQAILETQLSFESHC